MCPIDLKKKALEISNRFPFSSFSSVATETNGKSGTEGKTHDSGFDPKFMELLEQGAHLDVDKMPL